MQLKLQQPTSNVVLDLVIKGAFSYLGSRDTLETCYVQFRQKSILIQFQIQVKAHRFNSYSILIPSPQSLKTPWIPIPTTIPESELHITSGNYIFLILSEKVPFS